MGGGLPLPMDMPLIAAAVSFSSTYYTNVSDE